MRTKTGGSQGDEKPSIQTWFQTVQWLPRTGMQTDGRTDTTGPLLFFIYIYANL